MAKKFLSTIFIPKNPEKYKGSKPPLYRSSWELTVMRTFDLNPAVIAWDSEPVAIPYRNPFTMQMTVYVPDFLVLYADAKGKHHREMIEVKPAKEIPGAEIGGRARGKEQLRAIQAVNAAKWKAAMSFCIKRKIRFRVLTEHDIFGGTRKK